MQVPHGVIHVLEHSSHYCLQVPEGMAARILTSSDLPASILSSGEMYHEADDLDYGVEVRQTSLFK